MAIAFDKDLIITTTLLKADGTVSVVVRESKAKNDANNFVNEEVVKDITADIAGQDLTDLQTAMTKIYDIIKADLGVT